MFETIIFTVGGRALPHTSCSLQASAQQAVREATFAVAWNGPGLPCRIDEPATVHVSGELWGTGYVGMINSQHDANSRGYSVVFTSRTVDATECSIDHPTFLAKKVDLMGIAREFDTAGIGIEGNVESELHEFFKVAPGETLFDVVEQEARANGVLVYDTPKGKLKLASKPEGRHAGGLIHGLNILSASAQMTGATRHSTVKVIGQTPVGVTAGAIHPEAEASDSSVSRKRPLIVIFEGDTTSGRMKKRAAWEIKRGAGHGTSVTARVPGMRDEAGILWTRNFLIPVTAPWLGVEQDMVISDVTLEQDSRGGTTATLSLKDPRALGGEDPRGKSDDAWSTPSAPDVSYRAME